MLHHARTSRRTRIPEILRNRNRKRRLVSRNALRVIAEIRVREERLSNNGVGSRVHNRHICRSRVRRAHVEREGHGLPRRPGLHVGGVVGEFEALALPDITFGSVVVGLRAGDLELALDVAVVVGFLVVVDLFAAGGFHGGTGEAGLWGGDEAVGGDGGYEASQGSEVG